MSATGVASAAILQLAVAALYARVGLQLAGRADGGRRNAWRFFALFWLGIAAYGTADALWALALATVGVPLPVALVVLQVKILSAVAAFFGLVYYLLVVYTGRRGLLAPLLAAYAMLYVVVVFFYAWRDPVGQHVGVWGAALDYANEGGLFQDVVILLLFAPPAAAALAYAFLLRVAPDARSRARVATLSASLFLFFATLTMGWLNGRLPWWGLAEKLLALVAIGAVILALRLDAPASKGAPGVGTRA